jgi:magnesium transporter
LTPPRRWSYSGRIVAEIRPSLSLWGRQPGTGGRNGGGRAESGKRNESVAAARAMIVDCAYYRDRARQNEEPLTIERARELIGTGMGFVWLGLKDPSSEEVESATRAFDVPGLAIEDSEEFHQRPKLDEHGDHFFGVVKTAWYEEAKEEVHFGEIHVFLGPGYVITVRHGEAANLGPARRHLEQDHADLLDVGGAAVVWSILDQVVDGYDPVIAGIDDDIEEVEQAVFESGAESTERVYFLKREVIEFHRAVAPLIPPLEAIERGAFPQMPEELRRFFREVGGRVRRIDEQINSQRELLTSILEANLSLISVRQNQVVQAISAWAAIIAVPTFFASIWGMNFDHMPELGLRFGYPLALLVMLSATLLLYRFFKRIQWL